MIVTVNPTTHKVLLTSIPRDYYVQLHGTTGYKDKLTHAGIYGVNKSIETIEDFVVDISYKQCEINSYQRELIITSVRYLDTKISAVISAIIDFINWYNKTK